MKLVERISTQNATQATQAPARTSLMTSTPRRQRDAMADGFQQLKLAVHNRLFETLDVSRLESLEQNMASTKVTQAITEILNEEGRLLTDTDRARLVEEIKNELLGLGPLEPLLWDDDVQRHSGQRAQPGVRRAPGQALPDRRALQRRPAPDADHRPHRVAGRPARRRSVADGRCAPGRRLAYQRDHPAAGARRAVALDPAFRQEALHGGRFDRSRRRSPPTWSSSCRRSSRRG